MKAATAWPATPPSDAAFADEGEFKGSVLDEVWAGTRRWDDPEVTAFVSAHALDRVIRDPLAVDVVDRAPTLDEMIRIATDAAPAIGNEGPDRVLGTVACTLQMRDPIAREWLALAVAAASLFQGDAGGRDPWDFWAWNEPVPSKAERARVRAVARAPWVAYVVGERWIPCFDVDPSWLPTQAPRVIGPVVPEPGSCWFARVIATADGPVAPIAFPVRGLAWTPAVTTLVRWARHQDSRYSREMVLRRYGHHLVRQARPRLTGSFV